MPAEIICPIDPSRTCPTSCDFFKRNSDSQLRIHAMKLPQPIIDKELSHALERAARTISGLMEIEGIMTEGFKELGVRSPVQARQPACLNK